MSEQAKRVYLDVCVLCRPYDDQTQKRIEVETAALDVIMAAVQTGTYEMIVTATHDVEINRIKNIQKRFDLITLLQSGTRLIYDDLPAIRARVGVLVNGGVRVADATHVAFAEASGANFVTADDRLLKQCRRLSILVSCDTADSFCRKENLI